MTRRFAPLALAVLCTVAASPLAAQVSRDDSAAVLLDAARRLELEGQRGAADALLGYLLRNFGGTAAALTADSLMAVRSAQPERGGSGRVQLMAWGALYGAFLGVAVPAALGADDPAPFGVGLLLGGPGGFLAGRAYADAHSVTAGQAAAMTFGFRWGAWQAMGWRGVFEIGTGETCYPDGLGGQWCQEEVGRSPWTAMVLGGVGGLAAGTIIGNRNPSAGRVAFASHGAYWGTWYGFLLATIADVAADDDMFTAVLAGGDAGLLLGAIAAPKDVSTGRVWVTSALGMAGVAAGFGLDLIIQPEGDENILLVPAVTGIAGLAWGWYATRDMDRRRRAAPHDPGGPGALRLLPRLEPGLAVVGENARGRRIYRPAINLTTRLSF